MPQEGKGTQEYGKAETGVGEREEWKKKYL